MDRKGSACVGRLPSLGAGAGDLIMPSKHLRRLRRILQLPPSLPLVKAQPEARRARGATQSDGKRCWSTCRVRVLADAGWNLRLRVVDPAQRGRHRRRAPPRRLPPRAQPIRAARSRGRPSESAYAMGRKTVSTPARLRQCTGRFRHRNQRPPAQRVEPACQPTAGLVLLQSDTVLTGPAEGPTPCTSTKLGTRNPRERTR
jgi:hypothetical protein